jgi:hypothetical protein
MMKYYIDTDTFLEDGFVVPIEFTLDEHNKRADAALKADRNVLRSKIKVKQDKIKKVKKSSMKKKDELALLVEEIWDLAYARMVIDHMPIPQQHESFMHEKLAKYPLPELT